MRLGTKATGGAPITPAGSVPRLLLGSDGQHKHGISLRLVALQRDIVGIAEAAHQLAQLWQFM
jgi:hypothetical protein